MRLFRERRRLLVVTTLAFLAGYLMYFRIDTTVLGMAFPLFAGCVYGVIVGVCAALTSLFLPALRFTVELIAISRLMVAGGCFANPEFAMQIATQPLLNASLVVGGAILLRKFAFGRLSAQLIKSNKGVMSVRMRSDLPARVLAGLKWDELIETRFVEQLKELPGHTARRLGQGAFVDTVEIDDLGHAREIRFQIKATGMPLHALFSAWLDDSVGRCCDLLAKLQGELSAPAVAYATVEAGGNTKLSESAGFAPVRAA